MPNARKSAPAKKAARKTPKNKALSSSRSGRRPNPVEAGAGASGQQSANAGSTPVRGHQSSRKAGQNKGAAGSNPAEATTTKKGLTPGKRAFVAEYLKDKIATAAYKRAGYKGEGHSAEAAASRLLRDVEVRAEIDRLQAEALAQVQQDTGITLKRTLEEIARLAFFDPRKLFDPKGNPLALTDLDDETAAVIAGLDVLEEFDGTGKDKVFVGYIKKWKLADKKGALDMLMKHLGGYREDNKQVADSLAQLLGEMRRSTLPVNPNPGDADE